MPAHKRIFCLMLGICLLAMLPAGGAMAQMVNLEATLILASNDPAPLDYRLDNIEFRLRKVFGFEHYRHFGEQSAIVNLPGSTTLALGHGQRLLITATQSGDRVRSTVEWLRDSEVVLNTTVVMKRGTPVVLGGIKHDGGTLIITLTAK